MKRRYATRPDWPRIVERRFKLIKMNNESFKGYVSLLFIDKVTEPLVIEMRGKPLKLVDAGYKWLQFFPDGEYYSLTTLLNEKEELIEYYFDICLGIELDQDGIPFYDDIYLDVVLTLDNEIHLLDEDELEEALKTNDITKEQFDFAYQEAHKLIKRLKEEKEKLPLDYKWYLCLFS